MATNPNDELKTSSDEIIANTLTMFADEAMNAGWQYNEEVLREAARRLYAKR